jgi:hypothetical protein
MEHRQIWECQESRAQVEQGEAIRQASNTQNQNIESQDSQESNTKCNTMQTSNSSKSKHRIN